MKSNNSAISVSTLCFAVMMLWGLEPVAKADSLVMNGSFESTNLAGSARFTTTDVANWSTTSYTFLYFPGTGTGPVDTQQFGNLSLWPGVTNLMPATSPDGGNFVAADGAFEASGITQTVNGLTVGQKYNLTFYQAGAQQSGFNGPTTDQWAVTLGSQTIDSALMTNSSHDFQAWEKQTMVFTATASSELLTFLAVGTPSGVPPFSLLDGVSMTSSAPEPAYMGLIGVGLVLLGAVRRRHRSLK